MRPLTVLLVAYPLAPVGRDAVGGAEQIVAALDEALTRAGHRSIVIAAAGSRTTGRLVATPAPRPPLDDHTRAAARRRHRATLEQAIPRFRPDVVHLHGLDFHTYLPPPGVPALATLHLPPDWYPPGALRPDRPATYLNCVSAAQHRSCPPGPALLPPIENGVPVHRLGARVRRRTFALALGRVCPEKGFHLALDAARRADTPLLLGGQVYPYPAHQEYFHTEIEPRLDARRRFLGPLRFPRKRRLLAAARCLLAPSLAPETSSLAAMEALASGTPVIAFPNGALAEIVEHGVTGFLVHDTESMAEAIRAAHTLDPETCRAAARERFSEERMTREYLALYQRIARARPARER